jgi:hypothetical protein
LIIDHYSGKLIDFEMGHQRFTAEFSEFSQRGKSVSFLVKSPIANEVRIVLSQVPPLTGEPDFVITISANDSVGGRMYFVREVSASDRKKLRSMEPSNRPPRIASFPCYSAKGEVQNAICDNYDLGFMDYVYSLNVALRQQSDLKEGEERINPYEINKNRSDATNACSGDVKCLEAAYVSLNNKICQAPIIFGKNIFNCLPLRK